MRAFADIPVTVERLLTSGERSAVGVVLLDAFGRRFLERYAHHPFLQRLEITPIVTQFPPTTTAHVTTMHTGRPVGDHGLYEWNVYEPSLGEVVIPLRSDDCRRFLDGDTLYQRLPAPATVLQPSSFSPSPYDRVFTAGARLQPYASFTLGVQRFFDALAAGGYAYLYWDQIDAAGHRCGPESPQVEAAVLEALGTLEAGLRAVPGALVLVTADHGQVAVDPERIDELDELWPELPQLLTQPPAGSSRDVFLHTVPGAAETVVAGLAERLGDRADVRLADDLFETIGPRLRERLGDVCVLPADGRTAWLRSARNVAATFRGHHGGLHPDETETWVGALYS
jgi:hypothetical protein